MNTGTLTEFKRQLDEMAESIDVFYEEYKATSIQSEQNDRDRNIFTQKEDELTRREAKITQRLNQIEDKKQGISSELKQVLDTSNELTAKQSRIEKLISDMKEYEERYKDLPIR